MGEADWFAAISAVFVLGAGILMTALGERVMRIGGLSCMGIAVIGLTVWFGHYRHAFAQSPPIINNAPRINTFNQSGGNNTINLGTTRLPFDQAICDDVANRLPSGKHIVLESVGSNTDQKIADQYQTCLEGKGFKIQRSRIGVMAPPPDHKFTLGDPNAPQMVVILAPSAH